MTQSERYKKWYYSHLEEVRAKRREVYHDRKKIPLCPRCQSNVLSYKANGVDRYVLCQACRDYSRGIKRNLGKVNRIYKVLTTSASV